MSKTVNTGLAYLIEMEFESVEVVIAAKAIGDKLQDVAVTLGEIQTKDVIPMMPKLIEKFGQQAAERFSNVTTEKMQNLITVVQNVSEAVGIEIAQLEQLVDRGAAGAALPGEPAQLGDTGMVDAPDLDGAAADPAAEAPPEDPDAEFAAATLGGADNSAGRARKESRQRRGRRLMETKSAAFDANLNNLGVFHGKAGRIARQAEMLIDNSRMDGEQRAALSNVLSHLASVAADPTHWASAEEKVESALSIARVGGRDQPEVRMVVNELKKLGHVIAMQHEDMQEAAPAVPAMPPAPVMTEAMRRSIRRNVHRLAEAADPDALLLGVVRHQLRSGLAVKEAVRRTARAFAVDAADIADILREAAGLTAPARKRRIAEFDMHTPASAKGMFDGDDIADLDRRRASDKREIAGKERRQQGHAAATKDLRRVNFAIRAKQKNRWGKVKEAAPVAPLTPEQMRAQQAQQAKPGQPATGQPVTGQPVTGQPGTGQPVTGQPVTGQPVTGQPVTGQPVTGQPAQPAPVGTTTPVAAPGQVSPVGQPSSQPGVANPAGATIPGRPGAPVPPGQQPRPAMSR